MEVVAYFVHGEGDGFCEGTRRGDGGFFEEEADLVARREEVGVADMVGAGIASGAERGERVGGDVERGEEVGGFGEEGGDSLRGEGGGDDEVAVAVEGGELGGGEACHFLFWGGRWW